VPDQTVQARTSAAAHLSSILLSTDVDLACARLFEALQALGFDAFCLGASEQAIAGARHYTPVAWLGRMPFPDAPTARLGDFLDAVRTTGWLLVPLGATDSRGWVLAVHRDEAATADQGAIPLLELYGHALKAIVVPARVLPMAAEAALSPLSTIQLNYLRWAAEGKSGTDIAIITGASRRAVAYHFAEILRKLGVSSRAQAVAWLAQSGTSHWPDVALRQPRAAS
jgi:DNA-binding CsgD family transcriptional regulator